MAGPELPSAPADGLQAAVPVHGLPAGLTVLRPTSGDADELTALVRRCDLAVTGSSDATQAQTESALAAPTYDKDRAGVVVREPDGTAVGWLWTEREDDDAVFVDPYALDPAVLGWLMARAMGYARGLAVERGGPVEVSAGSLENDHALASALVACGLTVRRRFWRMLVDLTDPAAAAAARPTALPPGVVIRQPDPADEHTYVLLHRLLEDAFGEHWGHIERSYDEWRQRFDASAGLDPTQWWVADLDGQPAGLLIGNESRAELGRGWLSTLGVRPPARGRGIAKALLRVAFADAAARGRSAVGLAVDSENATGATALYESVGMRPETVMDVWRGEVSPST